MSKVKTTIKHQIKIELKNNYSTQYNFQILKKKTDLNIKFDAMCLIFASTIYLNCLLSNKAHYLEDILAQLTLQNLMKTNKLSLETKKCRNS